MTGADLRVPMASILAALLVLFMAACGDDGDGGTDPSAQDVTVTGTVVGMVVTAIDQDDVEVDRDTAQGTPKTFTLTIPVGRDYRFFFIEGDGASSIGIYPLYQGATNVFSVDTAVTIDLGFVDTSTGLAVPTNDPFDQGAVDAGENPTPPPTILLVGTWVGSNEGIYGICGVVTTFDPDGNFRLGLGTDPAGTYTTNTSVIPHHIDLTYDDDVIWEGENLGRHFYGLFEVDGNELRANWDPNERPME